MASQNRIILGLMTFGPDIQWGAKTTSLSEFGTFLDHFQAAGYDEVDTARVYQNGSQEGFTAAAGYKQRNLTLATKLYPAPPGNHAPETVRANLDESLKELQADYVDIFYLHAPDRSVPFEKTLKAVDELHREGKFRKFGLSNFAAFEVAEIVMICRANGWVRPTIYQALYNAITRSIESELIPACRRYGLDIVTYNGLAGGLFTGKYRPGKTDAPENPSFVDKVYRDLYIRDGNLAALSVIEPVVSSHGLTLIEVAMRWLTHHSALKMRSQGGNDGIIIGASNILQLDAAIDVLRKGPLPVEVIEALDKGWLIAKSQAARYWHGDIAYTYDTQNELFGETK